MAGAPADPSHPGIHGGRGASGDRWCWLAWCGCSQQGVDPQKCNASLPSAPVSASTCCPLAIDGCLQGCRADWGHSAPGCLAFFVFSLLMLLLQFSVLLWLQSHECSVCILQIYTQKCVCISISIHLYLYLSIYICIYINIHRYAYIPSTKSHLIIFLFKSRWMF